MTQTEILKLRLISVGYTEEQAQRLVNIYNDNAKLSELESYICVKEMIRGEI